MLKSIFKTTYIAAAATLIMTIGGCKDDFYDRNPYCPEGEPAVVSITLNAPEREQFTRSDLQPEQDNRINSLWLGIFNAKTGEVSTNLHIEDGNYGFTARAIENHTDIPLTGIPTVSGESRIVAVANPEGHTGCTIDDKTPGQDLLGLLKNVQSWDDYLKICVGLENSAENANVQTPQVSQSYALVMSGSFVPSDYDGHGSNQTWDDLLNKTVNIYPDNNKLAGKVHLRRLLSHIVFNIQPGGNIVDIEPVSWQVYNAPIYSWMHERTDYGNFAQGGDDNPVIDATNAGDALTPKYDDNNNYKPSLIYTSTDFAKEALTDGTNRNSYKFDFWMYENKRQGLEDKCKAYADREKEYSGTIGNLTEPNPTDPDAKGSMSGVFMSLTNRDIVTLNNKATYVDIPCVVTYLAKTDGNTNGSDVVHPEKDDDIATGATRVANVTYRIHLGYTNPNPQATDFNSYRNSSYTYNVTVQSVNNVLVEAFRKGDDQPGGFGTVTDVTDQYYELDAHYNAFNIELKAEDLSSFSFSMQSYEGNELHEIYGGLTKGSNIPESNDPNYKYYSWIEFLPTTEGVLAKYPGVGNSSLLHIGDFLPQNGQPSRTAGWYTVFVNEYVYEDGPNEENSYNWKNYVNQPNRNVWINVTEHVSADQASSYYKAKYAFSQKSIQTYYSISSDHANALGVEHEDENFGMNIRWTDRPSWSVGDGDTQLDNENGRWNARLFAEYDNTDLLWSKVVNFNSPQVINQITNTNQWLSSIYPDIDTKPRTVTVPMMNLLSGLNGNTYYNGSATDFDPQTGESANPQYYQGYYACMNRNRDLNGDGKISPDEIRWFLPTSGQMLRVILGRNSLKTPIMNYPNKDLPHGSSDGYDVLFHYLTSDFKIIWTEEGMSSNTFGRYSSGSWNTNQYMRAPWQVRCIRNLGTNLGATIQRENRISVAYASEVNNTTKGGVVKPTGYYGTALRNPSQGPIAIHKTNSSLNRLGQYGFEIAPRGNAFNQTGNNAYAAEQHVKNSTNNGDNPTSDEYTEYADSVMNTYCRSLDETTGRTGWRVPNQKEIIIMLRTTYEVTQGNTTTKSSILGYIDYLNAYLCVTQEYWPNFPTQDGVAPSPYPGWQYRFCTVSEGLAEAKNLGRLTYLRCVRDLTAAEANMTYEDIVKPKTKPAKKVVRKVVRKKKVRR